MSSWPRTSEPMRRGMGDMKSLRKKRACPSPKSKPSPMVARSRHTRHREFYTMTMTPIDKQIFQFFNELFRGARDQTIVNAWNDGAATYTNTREKYPPLHLCNRINPAQIHAWVQGYICAQDPQTYHANRPTPAATAPAKQTPATTAPAPAKQVLHASDFPLAMRTRNMLHSPLYKV